MCTRGQITMKRQSAAKLAETLPNFLNKLVVDETGLTNLCDLLLPYRKDGPETRLDALKRTYGLTLEPTRRTVKILTVSGAG